MAENLIYADYIDRLARKNKNKTFYNSNEEHAIIVLSAILRHARSKVCVYCTDMCSSVSEDKKYLATLESFFSKKGKMEILYSDYKEALETKPIYRLFQKYPSQVELRRISNEGNKIKYNNEFVNFTVTDNHAFRFETNVEKKEAKGNFNSPEEAIILNDIFTKYYRNEEISSKLDVKRADSAA